MQRLPLHLHLVQTSAHNETCTLRRFTGSKWHTADVQQVCVCVCVCVSSQVLGDSQRGSQSRASPHHSRNNSSSQLTDAASGANFAFFAALQSRLAHTPAGDWPAWIDARAAEEARYLAGDRAAVAEARDAGATGAAAGSGQLGPADVAALRARCEAAEQSIEKLTEEIKQERDRCVCVCMCRLCLFTLASRYQRSSVPSLTCGLQGITSHVYVCSDMGTHARARARACVCVCVSAGTSAPRSLFSQTSPTSRRLTQRVWPVSSTSYRRQRTGKQRAVLLPTRTGHATRRQRYVLFSCAHPQTHTHTHARATYDTRTGHDTRKQRYVTLTQTHTTWLHLACWTACDGHGL